MRRVALLTVATLALAAASEARPVSERDRGRVPAGLAERAGLTADERDALDIESVRIIGYEAFGVSVDVRFTGSVERHLGTGALSRAGVALVLRRESGPPSAVLARGGGLLQRVRRSGLPDLVSAVRDGRVMRFLLSGASFSTIRRVEVLTLTRAPRGARLPIHGRRADSVEVPLHAERTTPAVLQCSEIRPVYRSITRSIATMDAYIEVLDAVASPGPRVRATRDLAQDMRFVGLDLGGRFEVAHNEERC